MTNTIAYEFYAPPKEIKKKMRLSNLTGNEYKVMDTIVDLITTWPEGRRTFSRELACSYISKNLNLCESSISRAITGLISKNFLKVISLAKRGVGRILQIISNLETEKKSLAETASHSQNDLSKLQVKTATKKETTISKNNNNNPEPPPKGVVSSYININKGNKIFQSIGDITKTIIENVISPQNFKLTIKEPKVKDLSGGEISNKPSSPVCASKDCLSTENGDGQKISQTEYIVTIKGVNNKIMGIGIKILKDRGITKIRQALEDIQLQMETQGNIKNYGTYFLKLCKDKKNFSFTESNNSVSQKIAKKTEEYFRQQDREIAQQENCEVAMRRYVEKYPEKAYQVVQTVDNKPGTKFISSPKIKIALYVAEFKKQFPDLA